jgi:hypothetical protein
MISLKHMAFLHPARLVSLTRRAVNVKSPPSHGQMISWEDATSPKFGLAVEHINAADQRPR